MSFLIDPPWLYANGRAYAALAPERAQGRTAALAGAATMAGFWAVSVSLYLNRRWTRPIWEAGGSAPPDAGIDAPVVWIRESSMGHELWRGPHEGPIPEVGAELGRSSVDGRPWVVRRVEEANGRTAIHLSKEGPTGDPRLVGHHVTAGPRVP